MPPSSSAKSRKEAAANSSATRYEDDLYTWVQEQVALLRAGRLEEVDAQNVAEELADVGRSEFAKLVSAIEVLTMHMLKWDHQPALRSRSWEGTVGVQRDHIKDVLADNPALKHQLSRALERGYRYARNRAVAETKLPLDTFPVVCPYTFDELMTREIAYVAKPKRRRRKLQH